MTEVHILDFEEDIYDADIEVLFIEWVREARHFETRGALKKQIELDVQRARDLLNKVT